jgi:hypothetical protein
MDTVAIVNQILTVATAAIASGFVATAVTQLFKWRLFAEVGKKYPVPTAIVVSLVVSAGAIYLLNAILLTSLIGYVIFAFTTLLVATQTYDLVKKAVDNLRNPEL